MRKFFFRSIVALAVPIMVLSGCAKEKVKPDEGIASDKGAVSAPVVKEPAVSAKDSGKQAAIPLETVAKADIVADKGPVAKTSDKSAAELAAADRAKAFLKTVYFDFDSYVLTQTSRDTLYGNAEYLLKKYRDKVILEGHCDERGSDEYNLALGENRAKSVLNYLLTLGVPAEQLSIVSYGKERPVDDGHTEDAWAKNRRVEFSPVK